MSAVLLDYIKIDQAEGRSDRLVKETARSFEAARKALWRVAHQCPEGMRGYYKTDVEVAWKDGTTHSLRADVKGCGEDVNVGVMLKEWANYHAYGGHAHDEAEAKRAAVASMINLFGSQRYHALRRHALRLLEGELEVTI